MNKVYVIGLGPGDPQYVIPAAKEILQNVPAVFCAKRLRSLIDREDCLSIGRIDATLEQIAAKILDGDVAVAVSGDPLLYSMLHTIKRYSQGKDWEIEVIPGIGSLQMLGSVLGEGMEDAYVMSIHGIEKKAGAVALAVSEHEKVFFLCDRVQGPAWICDSLIQYGLTEVLVMAGTKLSYPSQRLIVGKPEEVTKQEFDDLSVVLVKNFHAHRCHEVSLLLDEDFIRGASPMTKEEVRAVILQRLRLKKDDILWDLGAGTGSISIEGARHCPFGIVYAVEYRKAAVELIERNKEKFHCDNLHICQGRILEEIEKLPKPDVIFVGGSEGELKLLISWLKEKKWNTRLVLTAVTMETMAEASQLMEEIGGYRMIQLQVGKSRDLAGRHLLDMNHPITIFETELS